MVFVLQTIKAVRRPGNEASQGAYSSREAHLIPSTSPGFYLAFGDTQLNETLIPCSTARSRGVSFSAECSASRLHMAREASWEANAILITMTRSGSTGWQELINKTCNV